MEFGDGVLGGGAVCALIIHLVAIAAAVEVSLQRVWKGLAGGEPVPCGNAVPEANQDGPVSSQDRPGDRQQKQRNKQRAANVHLNSVRD